MTGGREKVRVLVVIGDATLRHGLSRLLGTHPAVEVVSWAINGRTALPKVATCSPDVVLLDLEQNFADGLELLDRLHDEPSVQRVLIAPNTLQGEALAQVAQHGPAEIVHRPNGVVGDALVTRLVQELLPPLLRLGQVVTPGRRAAPRQPAPLASASTLNVIAPPVGPTCAVTPPGIRLPCMPRSPVVLGIGVSTGGPKALNQVLPCLPADFPLPVLVVQHMPARFTQSLAESLDKVCKLRVAEARDSDRVERGRILIAPGGKQMKLVTTEAGDVVRLSDDPPECSCRPSVDYLFRSLAEAHSGRVLGVVLTGMGEDGWGGSQRIHAAGGRILAQDEASSTVYGMPRGPIEAGIATAVPLSAMADAIVQVVRGVPCN